MTQAIWHATASRLIDNRCTGFARPDRRASPAGLPRTATSALGVLVALHLTFPCLTFSFRLHIYRLTPEVQTNLGNHVQPSIRIGLRHPPPINRHFFTMESRCSLISRGSASGVSSPKVKWTQATRTDHDTSVT